MLDLIFFVPMRHFICAQVYQLLQWFRDYWNVVHGCFDNRIFFLKDPIYLQSVIIHSANGGKGERWHVEEYSLALLC
jgi:hypothetical protein